MVKNNGKYDVTTCLAFVVSSCQLMSNKKRFCHHLRCFSQCTLLLKTEYLIITIIAKLHSPKVAF